MMLLIVATVCCSMLLVGGSPHKGVRTSEPVRPCEYTEWDQVFTIQNGESLERGCNVFRCVNGNLSPPTHRCTLQLNYLENIYLCLRRSSDGCCCEEAGCVDAFGETQQIGSEYRSTLEGYDPARPECGEFCQCGTGPTVCKINPCRGEIVPVPNEPNRID